MKTTKTTVETTYEVRLTANHVRALLNLARSAAENGDLPQLVDPTEGHLILALVHDLGRVPEHASVAVQVPGGGDWSNVKLGVGRDTPIEVLWSEVVVEAEDTCPHDKDVSYLAGKCGVCGRKRLGMPEFGSTP